MSLSFALGLVWLVAANVIGMFPSKDHHWTNAYRLIAVGGPLWLWLVWQNGPWWGLAFLVALFGFVALQIENTDLLTRIAAAVEGQGGPPARLVEVVEEPALRGRVATPRVEEPALRAPAAPRKPQGPQGRVEPAVTLRRTAG